MAFLAFSEAQNNSLLAPDAVEHLFKDNQTLPEKLNLGLYTRVRDSEKVAISFANWAAINAKTNPSGLAILAKF